MKHKIYDKKLPTNYTKKKMANVHDILIYS